LVWTQFSFDGKSEFVISGPQRITKEQIQELIPSCTFLEDEKDLKVSTERKSVDNERFGTLVWYFNNSFSNPFVNEIAQEMEKFCKKNNNRSFPFGDSQLTIQTAAFDMIDYQTTHDRRLKHRIQKNYGLSGHIHDMEIVLYWGDLPVASSARYSEYGFHKEHHNATERSQVKSHFTKFENWFRLLTHPVDTITTCEEVVAFLSEEHFGPSVIMPIPSKIHLVGRENFYHETTSVRYAELDKEKFQPPGPECMKELNSIGVEFQFWQDANFVLIKNHHAARTGQEPSAMAFVTPSKKDMSYGKKMYSAKDDLLTLLKPSDRIQASKNWNPAENYDTLKLMISGLDLPLVVSTINAEEVFEKDLPVYFIGVSKADELEPYMDNIAAAAEKLRGKAIFMVANGDPVAPGAAVSERLFHHLSLEPSEMPAIRLVRMKNKMMAMWEKHALYCPNFSILNDTEQLVQYIAKYESKDLRVCVRSEPLHEDMKAHGEAEVLIGENFYKEVFEDDKDKDLIIDAYAPWCGHCKAFEPQLRKLAQLAAHIPNNTLKITKIDATRNDLPGIGQLRGYPAILFFPGGKRNKPIEHRGSRAAEDLLKWISDRATNKFEVEDIINAQINSSDGSGKLSKAARIRAVLDEL